MDDLTELTHGFLALADVMKSCGLDPRKTTIIVSEKDGQRMELMMLRSDRFVISAACDPRVSRPKADRNIREFEIAGIKVQYRTKPFILPNGTVV